MQVSEVAVLVPVSAALLGAVAGGAFTRRNMRRDHTDKLLADALNELVASIVEVASGDQSAQRRYASALSRVALHGSPKLVESFYAFNVEANTVTADGRARLLDALQMARRELGRSEVDPVAAGSLLFGPDGPRPSRVLNS